MWLFRSLVTQCSGVRLRCSRRSRSDSSTRTDSRSLPGAPAAAAVFRSAPLVHSLSRSTAQQSSKPRQAGSRSVCQWSATLRRLSRPRCTVGLACRTTVRVACSCAVRCSAASRRSNRVVEAQQLHTNIELRNCSLPSTHAHSRHGPAPCAARTASAPLCRPIRSAPTLSPAAMSSAPVHVHDNCTPTQQMSVALEECGSNVARMHRARIHRAEALIDDGG